MRGAGAGRLTISVAVIGNSTGESTISPSSASSSDTGCDVEEEVETFVDASESDIIDAFTSSSISMVGPEALVGSGGEKCGNRSANLTSTPGGIGGAKGVQR